MLVLKYLMYFKGAGVSYGHFLFLACTKMLGSGNWSFNATQSELKSAQGQKSVMVLHSTQKKGNIALAAKTHVRGNTLCTTHLTHNQSSGPNKGITYANTTHIVITLIFANIRCFPKWRSFICATSGPFVRQEHLSQIANGISIPIRLQAENATPSTLIIRFITD